ncbi:hypothetical protein VHEMI01260 [[Torrubiella] hemipterigena]|uniref:Zn(2)-C6 fungal-type domain-containing protein n=1 Tax=[Torrubiella] hemipterigena TaxID=1531966 RepID=A0A0A1T712_9HYPO|nr:hypothetical protein VHEMI01260 [[Torrubiella] hemipterigena]
MTPEGSGRRRNGMQASCERCRKKKVKCDHRRPVCSPCLRRGLESQCFYHPAPLSKKHSLAPTNRVSKPTAPTLSGSASSSVRDMTSAIQSPERLTASNTSTSSISTGNTGNNTASHSKYVQNIDTPDRHLDTVKAILQQIKYADDIHDITTQYLSPRRLTHIPKILYLTMIDSLRCNPTASSYNSEDYARTVLKSSTLPLTITPDMDLDEFCRLATGPNLRIEVLGILFSTTASSILYGTRRDELMNSRLLADMIYHCNLSLQLARSLSKTPSDITIWLGYMNVHLMSLISGDESLDVWRRMSNLAVDLFALHVHREATHSLDKVPLFIAEIRKRIFATSNYIDKLTSLMFDRPPRLHLSYSDCKPPLDISDEALFSPELFAQECQRLTLDGWNLDVAFRLTSGARARFLIAGFIEQIKDMQLNPSHPFDEARLRDISARSKIAWANIPQYLQYSEESWKLNFSAEASLMLAKLYVFYCAIDYEIFTMISKAAGSTVIELLQVAWNVLEVMLQVAKARYTFKFPSQDLPATFLYYGAPSANILLSALEELYQGRRKELLPTLSKSALVRGLSVLVSQLEINDHATESSYAAGLRAARAISAKLDSILDGDIVAVPAVNPTDTNGDLLQQQQQQPQQPLLGLDDALALPNLMNFGYDGINWGLFTDWSIMDMEG